MTASFSTGQKGVRQTGIQRRGFMDFERLIRIREISYPAEFPVKSREAERTELQLLARLVRLSGENLRKECSRSRELCAETQRLMKKL